MLNIAVCDDEKLVTSELSELLLHYAFTHNREFAIKQYNKANDLLNTDFAYDVLYLDIMLDDNTDGTSIGRQLRQRGNKALFIITTSRKDKYADAVNATIFRYLLKPFTQKDIYRVMNEVYDYLEVNDTISITYKGDTIYIVISRIMYIDCPFKKINIYMSDGKVYCTSNETLNSFMERLSKHNSFCRIHKSHIINLSHIEISNKSTVVLKNGKELPIARGQYKSFQEKFNDYLGDGL